MTKDKENLYELKVALCNLVTIAENAVGKEEFEKLDNAGADIIDCLAELEKYRAIETVEECKKAVEIEKKILKHCEGSCADCHYKDPNDINKCMHDFLR